VALLLGHHEGGRKSDRSLCDWTFRSTTSVKGELHTPDFVLHSATTCLYSFVAEEPFDTVRLHVVTHHYHRLSARCVRCSAIVQYTYRSLRSHQSYFSIIIMTILKHYVILSQ